MEIAQIQAFVAVAEAGGFSRAANLLVSTQPTLSRQVAALERELGRLLFDRLGRRIELTNFGRDCLERARTILSHVDALAASGVAHAGKVTGLLRIGCADSVVFRRFPAVLQKFQRKYPGVRIRVRSGSSPQILDWVRDGLCDAGLCMLPRMFPELKLKEIWDDAFVAIVPPKHELAGQKVSLSRFASETQISIQEGTLSHQRLVAAYQDEGLSYVPEMSFDNFQLVVDLVRAGMGVALASRHVAESMLKRGHIAEVQVEGIENIHRSLGLAVHAERVMDGALAAFCEELDRVVAPSDSSSTEPVA